MESRDLLELVENMKDFGSKEEGKDLNSGNSSMMTINLRDYRLLGGKGASVPFHLPNIPRPQDEFQIFANNLNQPFDHVWLERSVDGSRYVHPLEKFPELEFIDKDVGCIEPVKPLPLEKTPFKIVEDVKELKLLAEKLKLVDEFAVDLEHNKYRSFQGLTCLMQISTRQEDYIVDTLKLRIHVGPHLREVFKDPYKKKVMHGADSDILWLQRDFGIYICNLFDTQQASKVLNLERNSLEFLLLYFCGVTVNKAYQNSDWRLRPLPDDMIKYAREDTHYLLCIYDQMRRRLLSASMGAKVPDDLLLVYKCSYDLCMQLYEKELLTDTSYLKIYGLNEADFNSQQLSIVAGLCEWRDAVARSEDESTGYILPNRTLLEIARQMPLTVSKLRRCVKSKHPYVDVNLDSIVELIRSSIQNASAFESAAQLLKMRHQETPIEQNMAVDPTTSFPQRRTGDSTMNGVNGKKAPWQEGIGKYREEYPKLEREIVECSGSSHVPSFRPSGETRKIQDGNKLNPHSKSFTISEQSRGILTDNGNPDLAKAFPRATEKVVDPPSTDFRPGSSTSNSQLETDQEVTDQKFGRVDHGEGGIKMKGVITNCLSASEHVNEEVSCQQKRSDSVEDGSRMSNQETDSVEDGSRMSNEETDSVEDGSRTINDETNCSTSEQESTECSSSQGSSFQQSGGVEESRTEEENTSDSLKESCTNSEKSVCRRIFCGAIEEVLNNTSQDSGMETLTSNSEIDSLSNGNVEKIKSNNGIEGAKNEGTTSSSNMSTKLLSYFQLKPKKEIIKPQEIEGFKSLLTSSSPCTNKLGSSIIRRIREDEVTKDFQQAKQYQTFLLRPGDQIVG
ncbi:Protein RRP6-like 2 [Ranunculus cassubicifolius]